MGFYINPKDVSKEEWLEQHAQFFFDENLPKWNLIPHGMLPVCLVDNGPFTAAGIMYSEEELKRWMQPDERFKYWYICRISDLLEGSKEFAALYNSSEAEEEL